MIETIQEIRSFVNRREVPSMHVGFLLGKPRAAPMFGSARLTPFDKRFSTVALSMFPKNMNILKSLTLFCENNPINLTDLVAGFGDFSTVYEEKANLTRIVWTNFEESEAVESFVVVIEGYQMEKHEGGLLLHQGNGATVVVPLSELMLPSFTFVFKEFERPEDKKNRNPIYR